MESKKLTFLYRGFCFFVFVFFSISAPCSNWILAVISSTQSSRQNVLPYRLQVKTKFKVEFGFTNPARLLWGRRNIPKRSLPHLPVAPSFLHNLRFHDIFRLVLLLFFNFLRALHRFAQFTFSASSLSLSSRTQIFFLLFGKGATSHLFFFFFIPRIFYPNIFFV